MRRTGGGRAHVKSGLSMRNESQARAGPTGGTASGRRELTRRYGSVTIWHLTWFALLPLRIDGWMMKPRDNNPPARYVSVVCHQLAQERIGILLRVRPTPARVAAKKVSPIRVRSTLYDVIFYAPARGNRCDHPFLHPDDQSIRVSRSVHGNYDGVAFGSHPGMLKEPSERLEGREGLVRDQERGSRWYDASSTHLNFLRQK